MTAPRETDGPSRPPEPVEEGGGTLMSVLFGLVSVLLAAALGYATWIALAYWDRVGV